MNPAPSAASTTTCHGSRIRPRSMTSWSRAEPLVAGITRAAVRTGSVSSSTGTAKPEKNTEASSASSASWTA